ncbi:MAG: hypothetical protein IKY45_02750, partial [Clostridia bacterium]|nr:hypothetical protein [Clostridia bacterium]
ITGVTVLVLILSLVSYFYIWGGKPYITNFDKVTDDYELVAQFALNSYSELKPDDSYPENESIIIDIYYDNLKHNDSNLSLTDEEKRAVLMVRERFGYLRVYEDAVFFCRDETGYYGLVYSKHPLIALYKDELPQDGREYHRINSRWYEWGVWGI